MPRPPLFEFRQVAVRFDGVPVLEDFSLGIRPGEKTVIRGKSGSGKSTLLRLLLGFARPDRGEVLCDGEALTPGIAWRLRRRVAFVNQGIDLDRGPVRDALGRVCAFQPCPEPPGRDAMVEALETFDLSRRVLDKETADLSGGERQRVALAAAILQKRDIFLLDEPTAALDAALTEHVAAFFLDGNPDWTVVAVSHDEPWHRPDRAVVVELEPSAETP